MKDMKIIFLITILLFVLACKKDSNVNFAYEVTVEDYYSEQPLEGRTVILKKCEGGSFVSGTPPCDSINFEVTDEQGIVNFNGTYQRGFGNGHEFQVLGGSGYLTTVDIRNWDKSANTAIRLKPYVGVETQISSSSEIDSLSIWISPGGYRTIYVSFNVIDSLITDLPMIPGEENQMGITAYNNDTFIWQETLYFTPVYGSENKLIYKFK